MSDPIEPIHHKLSDAVPDITPATESHQPSVVEENPKPSDMKQHNAEAHQTRKDHLIEIGRGEDTAGRGNS